MTRFLHSKYKYCEFCVCLKCFEVGERSEDNVVNGYLKQQQSLIPDEENSYHTIPALVIQLIVSFYYTPECFTAHGSRIRLNEQCDIFEYGIADSVHRRINTIYGNIRIDKQLYENKFLWEFEIIS